MWLSLMMNNFDFFIYIIVYINYSFISHLKCTDFKYLQLLNPKIPEVETFFLVRYDV